MTALGYSTPGKLMRLVLEAAAAGPGGRARWARCADLGCGTGLAGVEARPHVAFLAGCDLSGGMVAEARARLRPGGIVGGGSGGGGGSGASADVAAPSSWPLYDRLDVAEIEAWLRGPAARGGFDLVLAADVLVYIGALDGVFRAVAAAMGARDDAAGDAAGEAAGEVATAPAPFAAPRLFAFSTEAFPGEGEGEGESEGEGEGEDEGEGGRASGGRVGAGTGAGAAPGFALTGTGRCVHSRRYVRRVARAHGFSERRALRAAIRQNAGADVVGDLFVFELAR